MSRSKISRWLCAVAIGLGGCGEVVDPAAPDAAAPTVDSAPPVCEPSLTITSRFTIDRLDGMGPSTLDVMLNHVEGLVLTVVDPTLVRGLDPNNHELTTVVHATAWSADFTGQDGDLLDAELGQFLIRGGLHQGGLISIAADHLELFLVPEDFSPHPYVGIACAATTPTRDTGFPIVESRTITACDVVIWDGRSNANRDLRATANATFEIAYEPCP